MSMFLSPVSADDPATTLILKELKRSGNPFEILTEPQVADDQFEKRHVPDLHKEERKTLLEMIDWYRLEEYDDSYQLKPSRVVTVRGPRGSGKTHLLQSLIARKDHLPQVIVRPAFLNSGLAFEEYLLAQLKPALSQADEFHQDRALDLIAWSLTRQLLRQAILAASPADRLFAIRPEGRSRFRLLWRGGDQSLQCVDELLHKLAEPNAERRIPSLLNEVRIPPDVAYRLIAGHLNTCEIGNSPLVGMRRLLYASMARAVLFGDAAEMHHFLEDEYRQADPNGNRTELVACLFQLLVESCALIRCPIVFAFDNLEHLLSPQNVFDADLTQSLLKGLAQAVSTTQGILFFLFAEGGLFDAQVVPNLDDFVRNRMEQGISIEGKGSVHLIDLAEPTADVIQQLVKSRMEPLLEELSDSRRLSSQFPFSSIFLTDLLGSGSVTLRIVLRRLRDEYNRIIYEKEEDRLPENGGKTELQPDPGQEKLDPGLEPDPELQVGPNWGRYIEAAWSRGLDKARRSQEWAGQADYHNCLGALLQSVQPLSVGEWVLTKVTPALPSGEDPQYGIVSVLDWKLKEDSVLSGPKSLHVAVGFLLANGPGMAHDLRAKFDFLRDRERGVRLLILWLTASSNEDLTAALPPGTRKVWDAEESNHWRTELRRIEDVNLRRILAMRDLLTNVEEAAEQAPPTKPVREFLLNRASKVFPLLCP